MKVAVITSGFLPVPATKGGAVENLLVNVLKQNEKQKEVEYYIFSTYDEKAIDESKEYKETNFIFIKPNFIVKTLDKIVYWFAKNILKKQNSHSYRYIVQRLHYLRKVSKYLKKENYDKVVLENHPTQYFALKWKKNYEKYAGNYYYHCHNEFVSEYKCHDIIANSKKIICVSNYIKKKLNEYLKLDEKKFEVVRNGINEYNFKINMTKKEKLHLREKYNIDKNDTVLLFTGRIVKEKGVLELVKSIKNIDSNKYKLVIVGASLNALGVKSKYEEEVTKEIESIKNKVIFTGFVNYSEIPKIYNIADIAIMPSIWNDPAPLSIIESLTCGLPIITTNSGGIPEYANNKCSIILNRDENLVNNLSTAINNLINDKNKIKEMSQESLKAAEHLTIENYYKNFTKAIVEDDVNE